MLTLFEPLNPMVIFFCEKIDKQNFHVLKKLTKNFHVLVHVKQKLQKNRIRGATKRGSPGIGTLTEA